MACLELAGPQPAIGQQQREVQVGRLGAVERFQFGGRLGDLERLVVGQRQVEAEPGRDVRRRDLQGRLILVDRFLVAAQFGQHGAQVGACFHPVGVGGDAGLVFANRARQIPRLVQLDGPIQGTSGRGACPLRVASQQGEPQPIRQPIPALPGLEFYHQPAVRS